MFGFLGGRNRMRQIHDADKTRKGKGNNHGSKTKPHNRSTTTTRRPSSSLALEDHSFLDNNSVDMSLYTTPSRATLQYHRGVHHLYDWQSHDSSLTPPEVASVQSRLGGWEEPPPPRTFAETEEDNEIEGSRRANALQHQLENSSSRRRDSSNSTPSNRRGTSFCQRSHDPFIRETTSIQSSVKSQGPVDVDSVSYVEENFSELLSTFEAQSLAHRMAPNTARTHHERTKTKMIGNTTRQDDSSECSKEFVGSRSGREYATTRQNASISVSPTRSTRPNSITYGPNGSTKNNYETDTDSTAKSFLLDWDDSRSLATEVSGLTMLTMEHQSVPIQSRASEAASPSWKSHRPQPSFVSESTSAFSVPEDVSFSGLFSRYQDKSRDGSTASTTNNIKTHLQKNFKGSITGTFAWDNSVAKRRQQTEQNLTVDSRNGPRHSNMSGHYNLSTAAMDQSNPKNKVGGIEAQTAACQEKSTSFFSRSRSIASRSSECTKDGSKSEKESMSGKKENSYNDHDGLTPSEIDSLPPEESLDEVSFSGLFSTIEGESLVGRLASTLPLQNVEIRDSQSEVLSSTESFEHEASYDLQSIATYSDHQEPTKSSSRRENDDDLGAGPLTPTTRIVSPDIASVKAIMKRSNVNSSCDLDREGLRPVFGAHDATTFSDILSIFDARSAASNKLEPPVAKRLLPRDGFSIYQKEPTSVEKNSSIAPHLDCPSIVIGDVCSMATKDSHNEGKNKPVETLSISSADNASVPSTLVEDDYSSDSRCSLTIDDQSSILPPPVPDECSWHGNSWNSDGRKPDNMFTSTGSIDIEAMSNMSSMEEFAGSCCLASEKPINDGDEKGHSQPSSKGKDASDIVSTGTGPKSTPKRAMENIRQESASIETSLQYSQSTDLGNVVSDISSLLISADKHRNLPKKHHLEGPIDLDETVADSNSEASSSWYGSASIVDTMQDTPLKPSVNEQLQVESPLSGDDEDDYQFVDDDDELGDDEELESSFSSLHNETYVNEATVERSYKETMESLCSVRYESGSLLLTESELKKHMKSTQFKGSLPTSNLRGYDTWKRKQLETQRYFALIHKEAMKRKEKRDRVLEQSLKPSQMPHHLGDRQVESGGSATAPTLEWSLSSTTQTSRTSERIPQRRNSISSKSKRGWGFLRGGALKKGGRRPVSTTEGSHPRRKCEPAVDHMTKVSGDEPDDISLIPMKKLDAAVVSLTSLIAQDSSVAATKSRNSDDVGPRLLVLQHLEMERAKNREAEEEKTNKEIQEQNRIAMLKERELERQRRLNAPRPSNLGHSIFSSKLKCDTQGSCTDQLLQRNLSFGTTNTAQSSIRSPASVLSPCILCNGAERSHVAQPCMHFYFCQDCANELRSSVPPVCPICTTTNVSFSRVYT